MTIYRDDLERVYALIEDPERWAKGFYAYNAQGAECDEHSASAVKWCLDGAFNKCGLDSVYSEQVLHLQCGQTPTFNDTHTHAEVLALLRAAIERAPVRT